MHLDRSAAECEPGPTHDWQARTTPDHLDDQGVVMDVVPPAPPVTMAVAAEFPHEYEGGSPDSYTVDPTDGYICYADEYVPSEIANANSTQTNAVAMYGEHSSLEAVLLGIQTSADAGSESNMDALPYGVTDFTNGSSGSSAVRGDDDQRQSSLYPISSSHRSFQPILRTTLESLPSTTPPNAVQSLADVHTSTLETNSGLNDALLVSASLSAMSPHIGDSPVAVVNICNDSRQQSPVGAPLKLSSKDPCDSRSSESSEGTPEPAQRGGVLGAIPQHIQATGVARLPTSSDVFPLRQVQSGISTDSVRPADNESNGMLPKPGSLLHEYSPSRKAMSPSQELSLYESNLRCNAELVSNSPQLPGHLLVGPPGSSLDVAGKEGGRKGPLSVPTLSSSSPSNQGISSLQSFPGGQNNQRSEDSLDPPGGIGAQTAALGHKIPSSQEGSSSSSESSEPEGMTSVDPRILEAEMNQRIGLPSTMPPRLVEAPRGGYDNSPVVHQSLHGDQSFASREPFLAPSPLARMVVQAESMSSSASIRHTPKIAPQMFDISSPPIPIGSTFPIGSPPSIYHRAPSRKSAYHLSESSESVPFVAPDNDPIHNYLTQQTPSPASEAVPDTLVPGAIAVAPRDGRVSFPQIHTQNSLQTTGPFEGTTIGKRRTSVRSRRSSVASALRGAFPEREQFDRKVSHNSEGSYEIYRQDQQVSTPQRARLGSRASQRRISLQGSPDTYSPSNAEVSSPLYPDLSGPRFQRGSVVSSHHLNVPNAESSRRRSSGRSSVQNSPLDCYPTSYLERQRIGSQYEDEHRSVASSHRPQSHRSRAPSYLDRMAEETPDEERDSSPNRQQMEHRKPLSDFGSRRDSVQPSRNHPPVQTNYAGCGVGMAHYVAASTSNQRRDNNFDSESSLSGSPSSPYIGNNKINFAAEGSGYEGSRGVGSRQGGSRHESSRYRDQGSRSSRTEQMKLSYQRDDLYRPTADSQDARESSRYGEQNSRRDQPRNDYSRRYDEDSVRYPGAKGSRRDSAPYHPGSYEQSGRPQGAHSGSRHTGSRHTGSRHSGSRHSLRHTRTASRGSQYGPDTPSNDQMENSQRISRQGGGAEGSRPGSSAGSNRGSFVVERETSSSLVEKPQVLIKLTESDEEAVEEVTEAQNDPRSGSSAASITESITESSLSNAKERRRIRAMRRKQKELQSPKSIWIPPLASNTPAPVRAFCSVGFLDPAMCAVMPGGLSVVTMDRSIGQGVAGRKMRVHPALQQTRVPQSVWQSQDWHFPGLRESAMGSLSRKQDLFPDTSPIPPTTVYLEPQEYFYTPLVYN